jgi:hypothetical protein
MNMARRKYFGESLARIRHGGARSSEAALE